MSPHKEMYAYYISCFIIVRLCIQDGVPLMFHPTQYLAFWARASFLTRSCKLLMAASLINKILIWHVMFLLWHVCHTDSFLRWLNRVTLQTLNYFFFSNNHALNVSTAFSLVCLLCSSILMMLFVHPCSLTNLWESQSSCIYTGIRLQTGVSYLLIRWSLKAVGRTGFYLRASQ